LLQRLQVTFGICDVAHRWIQSYLSGRTQHVRLAANKSLQPGWCVASHKDPSWVLYCLSCIPSISYLWSNVTACRLMPACWRGYIFFEAFQLRHETSDWMKSNRETDALISVHWLRASPWIEYKVAVLTYKALHGSAPRYLGSLVPVADLQGRRTLRSAGTNRLVVPSVKLSTVGSRAFSVAAPRIWNALPANRIQTSSSDLSHRLSSCVIRPTI